MTHPHGQEVFLISLDIFFRPVNTHIGPDGAIYIVDMARGIIQDAPWLSQEPREFIRGASLDKVIQRGRIWRVHGALSSLMPVMANGLMGPIDGVTYQANYMAPAHALGITRDDRLAELLSCLRFAWGGNRTLIKPDEVKEWRRKLKDRDTPWTDEELKKLAE